MLSNQYVLGSLLITGCVIFHVLALLLLSKILGKTSNWLVHFEFIKKLCLLVFSVLFVIVTHLIEIVFWAITYIQIKEFENFTTAVYFSIVTSTTLGYGDIVLSEKAQLLSGFEAIGGLILFGVSTAFFIRLISIFFEKEST